MPGVVVGVGVQRGPLRSAPAERLGARGTGGGTERMAGGGAAKRDTIRAPRPGGDDRTPPSDPTPSKSWCKDSVRSLKHGEKSKSSQALCGPILSAGARPGPHSGPYRKADTALEGIGRGSPRDRKPLE